MLVRDIMTANPLTVTETTTIHETARLMSRHRITGLPVLNEANRVIGIVSESDLFTKKGTIVGDVMTREVISITSDTSVEILTHLLTDHRIRRLPVIDGDKLVGIVSRADIVRMMSVYMFCEVCGEAFKGELPPEACPKCGARSSFTYAMPFPAD
jgi:CBS domain-containing protein